MKTLQGNIDLVPAGMCHVHGRRLIEGSYVNRKVFQMKRWIVSLAIVALMLSLKTIAVRACDMDYDIMLYDVELRPNVYVDIHLKVYVNEECPWWFGRTIFALTGGYQDATHWEGLAEEMFEDNPAGRKLSRFVAMDLPGHGLSSLPDGDLLYGELTLDDYVTSLIATLHRIRFHGVFPRTLMGHCMGGTLVAMAQQRLLDQGTNLRRAFWIRNVVLTSPVGPSAVPYSMAEDISGLFGLFYMCFTGPGGTYPDPMCAMVDFDMDTDVDYSDILLAWPTVTFDCDPLTMPLGIPPLPAPDPPNCDPLTILGDTTIFFEPGLTFYPESLTAIMEIFGALQYPRPDIDPEIFTPHWNPRFSVVNFEMDTIMPPDEGVLTYEYLTGDSQLKRYYVVTGDTATHWMPFADPRGFLEGIAGHIALP